jgi:hypothetical protein
MARLALALSAFVVVAWLVLSATAWWSNDDLVGIALLVIAFGAVTARSDGPRRYLARVCARAKRARGADGPERAAQPPAFG